MRVAAGSFAGLMPITAGLAAANALPAPIQSALSSAFKTAGINVPAPTSGLPTDAGGLLADGPRADDGADVGGTSIPDEPIANDDVGGHAAPHRIAPTPPNNSSKDANHTNPHRSDDAGQADGGQSGGVPSGGVPSGGGSDGGGNSGGAPSGGVPSGGGNSG